MARIVKLLAMLTNMDSIPLGIPVPLIVGRGVDVVAIVTYPRAPQHGVDAQF